MQIYEESNESASIVLSRKGKCLKHGLSFKLFCMNCGENLCIRCLLTHQESSSHHYKEISFNNKKPEKGRNGEHVTEDVRFSLKNSLKEEFYNQGVRIIEETKERLKVILENYCTSIVEDYHRLVFKAEDKSDFLMTMSKTKLEDSECFGKVPSRSGRKIIITEEGINNFEEFLKECLSISNAASQKEEGKTTGKEKKRIMKGLNIQTEDNQGFLRFLYALVPNYEALFLFDPRNEQSRYASLIKEDDFVIPRHCNTVQISGSSLLVFSGYLAEKNAINRDTFLINLSNFGMRSLFSSSCCSKLANGVAIMGRFVYSIGGKDERGIRSRECERFNLDSCKWERIGALKYTRSCPSVVAFLQSIYVFFGLNQDNQSVSTIEKLTPSNEWVLLPLSSTLPKLFQATCVPINRDEILVFGGYKVKSGGSKAPNRRGFIVDMRNLQFSMEGPRKLHPLLSGSSQTCDAMVQGETVMSLRYVNRRMGNSVEEFEEAIAICELTREESRVLEVVNCKLLERIIRK